MRGLNLCAFVFCTWGMVDCLMADNWAAAAVLGLLSFGNFWFWEVADG